MQKENSFMEIFSQPFITCNNVLALYILILSCVVAVVVLVEGGSRKERRETTERANERALSI